MNISKIVITALISLSLTGLVKESQAEALDLLPTIELETPIHFLAPDGSDVVIESGRYQVEAAESWIRLIPGERRDAFLLIAKSTRHDKHLDTPQAGLNLVNDDTQSIILRLPGGKSLEAIGSVSGVRSRAITRRRTARTSKSSQKISRLPAQIQKRPTVKPSKGLRRRPPQTQQSGSTASTTNTSETNVNALVQRVQTLEQQVNGLLSVIQIIQGGAIIQAQNLSLQSNTLNIETNDGLNITSGKNLSINADRNLTARGGKDLKLKGDRNAQVESGATTTVKGGSKVKVDGVSRLDLKGPVVYIGSGSGMKPVATVGSVVNSVGGIGVSAGAVATGSATVFVK